MEAGERVAVIGPNGAGKSTLFKAIVGVKQVSSGQISIYGEDTHSSHTNVGYVPQQSAIDWSFPASVFDVVMMGRSRHMAGFAGPARTTARSCVISWLISALRTWPIDRSAS